MTADFWKIFNEVPVDIVSAFTHILKNSSGARRDELLLVSGWTQIYKPFGGLVLLPQWRRFDIFREKRVEKEKIREKMDGKEHRHSL